MDVGLHRQSDGSIKTTVYRKQTHTDKYLDFNSHNPISNKIAVVRTLYHRATTHTTGSALSTELSHVKSSLLKNGYPKSLIDRHTRPIQVKDKEEEKDPRATICLPYVRGTSEVLRRILESHDIRVAFKPCSTLKQALVHPKDSLNDLQKANVVYKITCADCPASYVGETKRRLGTR